MMIFIGHYIYASLFAEGNIYYLAFDPNPHPRTAIILIIDPQIVAYITGYLY